MKKPGRPKLDKVKHRLSFSKQASKVLGRVSAKLGIDRSEYIERLLQQANPKDFPDTVFAKVLTNQSPC